MSNNEDMNKWIKEEAQSFTLNNSQNLDIQDNSINYYLKKILI